MDTGRHVSVPLRAGKRMRKRRELDALAAAGKRPPTTLLSESTDEDSWSSKQHRAVPRILLRPPAPLCAPLLRACTAALVFACVVATVTVMWLFIDIREQVTALRTELDQVIAGNQAVPDVLQKCHSLSRELQQNQTAIFSRLVTITNHLGSFNSQLIAVQAQIHELDGRLKDTPELVNIPAHLADLSTTVASFGSQIRDLNSTVKDLKAESSQLQAASSTHAQNITSLKESLNKFENITVNVGLTNKESVDERDSVHNLIADIAKNISIVNDTLSEKFHWIDDDRKTDHGILDTVQGIAENVSARVATLEAECVRKISVDSLNTTISALLNQVKFSAMNFTSMNVMVNSKFKELEDNSNQLRYKISQIESSLSQTPFPESVPDSGNSTTSSV